MPHGAGVQVAVVLAAIITLVGTLAVGGVGVWQWQRTQAASKHKDYRAKRVETLSTLWNTLAGIEKEQRDNFRLNTVDQKTLNDRNLRDINMLLIQSAPFLLDDERDWAAAILRHLIEIDTSVRIQREHGLPGVDWWATTAIQPKVTTVTALAAQGLRRAHEALAERYAAVTQGNHD
jgi:hypothetical protein